MKFRVIWVGSNADAEFAEAVDRYMARVRHFFPIEIIEVRPEKGRQKQSDAAILHAESERLTAAIPLRGTTVAVDERGEAWSSLKFAKWLERVTTTDPHGVNFVMGGDLGMNEAVRKKADKLLSLSAMTLPHQIARVVLLEQLYRACTLMRNIRYHK